MKIEEHKIFVKEEALILTNQRAIFWERKKALIISDVHLGKAAHFRKNGIAIPTQIALQDLLRLEQLLTLYNAEKLIIVGDLIHAGSNNEVELLSQTLLKFPQLTTHLIKGNHDRISLQQLQNMGVQHLYQQLEIDNFIFSHHPKIEEKKLVISGHIHPGINVSFPAKKTMRFPCYVVTKNEIILPAFSSFTGLDTNKILDNASYYAFYEKGIFKV